MITEFHELIESYFNRSPLPIHSNLEPEFDEIVYTVDKMLNDETLGIIEFIIRDGKVLILSAVQENTNDDFELN
jgi:hypothetical protein